MPLPVLTVLLSKLGLGHCSACWVYVQWRTKQAVCLPSRNSGRAGGWIQNAKHVISTVNPVVSVSPVPPPSILEFRHSICTCYALVHELAQTSSALFQPQRASLSLKIQYKQMTRKVKESRHTEYQLQSFYY